MSEKTRSGPQRHKFPPPCPKFEPLPKRFSSPADSKALTCNGHLLINRRNQRSIITADTWPHSSPPPGPHLLPFLLFTFAFPKSPSSSPASISALRFPSTSSTNPAAAFNSTSCPLPPSISSASHRSPRFAHPAAASRPPNCTANPHRYPASLRKDAI